MGEQFTLTDALVCVWCDSDGMAPFGGRLHVPEDGNGEVYCSRCTIRCKTCERVYCSLVIATRVQEQFAICSDCGPYDVVIINAASAMADTGTRGVCTNCKSCVVAGTNGHVFRPDTEVSMHPKWAYCHECIAAGSGKCRSKLWKMVCRATRETK